jgi:non-ribosomal peptide synthetase component F
LNNRPLSFLTRSLFITNRYVLCIFGKAFCNSLSQKHFVSYRQLDQLANRLAQTLTGYTVPGDERIIPICFNKGIDMVVSILAILKAGCGYVPIDAEGWGNDRINTIVGISKARVCLVGPDLYDRMSNVLSDPSLTLLTVDALSLEPSTLKPDAGKVLPSDLAYVLFTSGRYVIQLREMHRFDSS